MSVTDKLLKESEGYAGPFEKGDLPMPPGRKAGVVAWMDARPNPETRRLREASR